RTRLPLSSTTRSRTSMIDSFAPSHSDCCEKHGKNTVEHNDEEDRFNDRVGGLFAERLGASLNLQPFHTRHDADDQGHERRFDHSYLKCGGRDCLAKARQKDLRLDASIQPGYE